MKKAPLRKIYLWAWRVSNGKAFALGAAYPGQTHRVSRAFREQFLLFSFNFIINVLILIFHFKKLVKVNHIKSKERKQ